MLGAIFYPLSYLHPPISIYRIWLIYHDIIMMFEFGGGLGGELHALNTAPGVGGLATKMLLWLYCRWQIVCKVL